MLGLIPANAKAQSDEVKIRNNCRLADQIIRTGHPDPHADWARGILPTCDVSMRSALAVHVLGGINRLADSEEQRSAIFLATGFYDRNVASALLRIAEDPSASLVARVESLRVLAAYVDGRPPATFEDLMAGVDELGLPRNCRGASFHGRGWEVTEDPFRIAEWLGLRDRAESLWADETTPPPVRAGAACVM